MMLIFARFLEGFNKTVLFSGKERPADPFPPLYPLKHFPPQQLLSLLSSFFQRY